MRLTWRGPENQLGRLLIHLNLSRQNQIHLMSTDAGNDRLPAGGP